MILETTVEYGDHKYIVEYDTIHGESGQVRLVHHDAEIPFSTEGLFVSKGIQLSHYLESKAVLKLREEGEL